jgi:nitronate monooxygenase
MTHLRSLFGVDLPIIQAPMAGVQGSALALAVAQAGGLGSLPCAMLTPDTLRSELSALARHGVQPLNVNFFCHRPPPDEPEREARFREALAPYFDELEVPRGSRASAPTRAPFGREFMPVLAEFKPAVVSFHFGLPVGDLLREVRALGCKVIACATTLDEVRWLAEHDVHAIVAQGFEAGGHRGMFLSDDLTTQVGTLALVRQAVKAVRVPVIAAGGISDAHGVSAALALGAAGVQVGTSYLLCPEASTSAVHRAALASPGAAHTTITNVFTGRPARSIVNRLVRELGPMSALPPAFPLANPLLAPLRSRAESLGSGDFSPLWAGQDTSGCKAVSAAQVTRELAGAPF